MNKERMELVHMTRAVVEATDGEPTRRMARVVESRLDMLIAAEKRAIIQMEHYKSNAKTAANYERAEIALEWLDEALQAAIDEDWERVQSALAALAESGEDWDRLQSALAALAESGEEV